MTELVGILSVAFAVLALLFAILITWTSLQAFRRSGLTTHLYAFVGFVFLTGGILLEELLLNFSTVYLHTIHTVESLLFVIGFGFLYVSIR